MQNSQRIRTKLSGAIPGIAAAAAILWAAPVQGQVAWESPMLVSPGSPAGWGVFLVDPSPGSGIGVLGTWQGPGMLGFRIGLAEGRRDRLAVYGGIDASGSLVRHSADFPLDVDWVTGAGLGIGDSALLSFPLGLSAGRAIQAEGLWLNPYLAPRVVLDAWLGDDRPRDQLRLRLAADLGLDIAFDPSWAIRFAASLGDRSALAIGLSFRGP